VFPFQLHGQIPVKLPLSKLPGSTLNILLLITQFKIHFDLAK
jgi:hypothetical protein